MQRENPRWASVINTKPSLWPLHSARTKEEHAPIFWWLIRPSVHAFMQSSSFGPDCLSSVTDTNKCCTHDPCNSCSRNMGGAGYKSVQPAACTVQTGFRDPRPSFMHD